MSTHSPGMAAAGEGRTADHAAMDNGSKSRVTGMAGGTSQRTYAAETMYFNEMPTGRRYSPMAGSSDSDPEPESLHQRIQRKAFNDLVQNLDPEQILVPLKSAGVLSHNEYEECKKKATRHEKSEDLLTKLRYKGEDGYTKFCEILRKNQEHLMKELDDIARKEGALQYVYKSVSELELKKTDEEIKDLTKKISEEKKAHKQEMMKSKSEHDSKVKELEQKHRALLETTERKYEAEKGKILKELQQEQDRKRAVDYKLNKEKDTSSRLSAEISRLEEKLDKTQKKYEALRLLQTSKQQEGIPDEINVTPTKTGRCVLQESAGCNNKHLLLMTCLHAVCKKCVEQHKDSNIVCLCGKMMEKRLLQSDHVNTNKLMISMKELECAYLKHSCRGKVVAHCNTCNVPLCEQCRDSHDNLTVNSVHVVVTIDDLAKNPPWKNPKHSVCAEHPGHQLVFMDTTCKKPICDVCSKENHREHDTRGLKTEYDDTKNELNKILKKHEQRLGGFNKCLEERRDQLLNLQKRHKELEEDICTTHEKNAGTYLARMKTLLEDMRTESIKMQGNVKNDIKYMCESVAMLEPANEYTKQAFEYTSHSQLIEMADMITRRMEENLDRTIPQDKTEGKHVVFSHHGQRALDELIRIFGDVRCADTNTAQDNIRTLKEAEGKCQFAENEVCRLQTLVSTLTTEKEELQKIKDDLDGTLKKLQSDVDDLRETATSLSQEKKQLEQESKDAQERYETADAERKELYQSKSQMTKENEALQTKMQQLREELDTAHMKIHSLQESVDTTTKRWEEKNKDHTALQERYQVAESEVRHLQEAMEQLLKENGECKKEKEQLESKLTAAYLQIEELQTSTSISPGKKEEVELDNQIVPLLTGQCLLRTSVECSNSPLLLLPCLHAVCRSCVDQHSDTTIKCTCDETYEKDGLESDFVSTNKLMLAKKEYKCSFLTDLCLKKVVSFCISCYIPLCEDCLEEHGKLRQNATHDIISVDSIPENPPWKHPTYSVCREHPGHELAYMDKTCKKPICHKCCKGIHEDHEVRALDKEYNEKRDEISSILQKHEHHLSELRNCLEERREQLHYLEEKHSLLEDEICSTHKENAAKYLARMDLLLQKMRDESKRMKNIVRNDINIMSETVNSLEPVHAYAKESLEFTSQVELLMLAESITKRMKADLERCTPEDKIRASCLVFIDHGQNAFNELVDMFGEVRLMETLDTENDNIPTLQNIQEKCHAAEDRTNQLQSSLTMLSVEQEQLQKKVDSLEDTLRNFTVIEHGLRTEISTLRRQKEEMEKENQDFREKCQNAERQIQHWMKSLDDLSGEMENVEMSKKLLESEIAELKCQLQEMKSTNTELTRQKEGTEYDLIETRNRYQTAQDTIQQLSKERDEIEKNMGDMKSKLEIATLKNSKIETLETDIRTLTTEKEEVERDLRDIQEDYRTVESEKRHLQASVDQLSKETEEYKMDKEQLENKLAASYMRIQELQATSLCPGKMEELDLGYQVVSLETEGCVLGTSTECGKNALLRLPCLHAVCQTCVNQHSGSTITCRCGETGEKEALQYDFVSKNKEMLTRKNYTCSFLTKPCPKKVVSYCISCCFPLCGECLVEHGKLRQNATHDIISVDSIPENPPWKHPSYSVCREHPGHELAYMDKICKKPICHKCCKGIHEDHEVRALDKEYNEKRDEISSILQKHEHHLSELRNCLEERREQLHYLEEKHSLLEDEICSTHKENAAKYLARMDLLLQKMRDESKKMKTFLEKDIGVLSESVASLKPTHTYAKESLEFTSHVELLNLADSITKRMKDDLERSIPEDKTKSSSLVFIHHGQQAFDELVEMFGDVKCLDALGAEKDNIPTFKDTLERCRIAEAEADQLKASLITLKVEKEQTEKNVDLLENKIRHFSAVVQELETEKCTLRRQKEEMEKEAQDCRGKWQTAESEIDDWKTSFTEVSGEKEITETTKIRLENDLQRSESRIEELQTINNNLSQERDNLKQAMGETKRICQTQEATIQQLQTSAATLLKEKDHIEKNMDVLKRELEAACSESSELESLKKTITILSGEKEEIKRELKETTANQRQRETEMEEKIENQGRELRLLTSTYEKDTETLKIRHEKENAQLRDLVAKEREEKTKMETLLHQEQARKDAAVEKCTDATNKTSGLMEEISELKTKLSRQEEINESRNPLQETNENGESVIEAKVTSLELGQCVLETSPECNSQHLLVLPCLHAVCQLCVDHQNHKTVLCRCGEVTDTETITLQHDFVNRNRVMKTEGAFECGYLTTACYRKVVSHCNTCNTPLCLKCQRDHSKPRANANHEVVAIEEHAKSHPWKDPRYSICPDHPGQQLMYMDKGCKRPICDACYKLDHKTHVIKNLDEEYKEKRDQIEKLLEKNENLLSQFRQCRDQRRTRLQNVVDQHNQVKNSICSTHDDNTVKYLTRTKSLLRTMKKETTNRQRKVEKDIGHFSRTVGILESTINYTKKSFEFTSQIQLLALADSISKKLNLNLKSHMPEDKTQGTEMVFYRHGQKAFNELVERFGDVECTRVHGADKDGDNIPTIEELQKECQKRNEEIKKLNKEAANVVAEKVKVQKNLNHLSSELNASNVKIEELKSSISKLTKEKEAGEKKARDFEKNVRELELQKEESEKSLKSKISSFLTSNREIEGKYQTAVAEVQLLTKERNKLKREADELQRSGDQLHSDYLAALEEISALQSEVKACQEIIRGNEALLKNVLEERVKEEEEIRAKRNVSQIVQAEVHQQAPEACRSREEDQLQMNDSKPLQCQKDEVLDSQHGQQPHVDGDCHPMSSNSQRTRQTENSDLITVEEDEQQAPGTGTTENSEAKAAAQQSSSSVDGVNVGKPQTKSKNPIMGMKLTSPKGTPAVDPKPSDISGLIKRPQLKYDSEKVNLKYAHIKKNGFLTNSSSTWKKGSNRFKKYYGTTSKDPLQHKDRPQYLEIRCFVELNKPLEDHELVLEIGLCREGERDVDHRLPVHNFCYSLNVVQCPEHSKVCIKVWRSGTIHKHLSHILHNTAGSHPALHFGLVYDSSRSKIVFLDVNKLEVIGVVSEVNCTRDMWPMFGVYAQERGKVNMELIDKDKIDMTTRKVDVIQEALKKT